LCWLFGRCRMGAERGRQGQGGNQVLCHFPCS
jgi:hypothetical protein